MLLTWACALSLEMLAVCGALADNRPPPRLCDELRGREPAPPGVLDLRVFGLPCGFKPLIGTAVLLITAPRLMDYLVPGALALGFLFWAAAGLVRTARAHRS